MPDRTGPVDSPSCSTGRLRCAEPRRHGAWLRCRNASGLGLNGFYSGRMTRWTRLAASTGLTAAVALGIVATSAEPASAASCVRYYWVNQVPAPVRENPSSASVVRKYKQVFDTVTGP